MESSFENLAAHDNRVETNAKRYADVLKLCATLTVKKLLEQHPELQAVKESYRNDKRDITSDIYEEFYIYNLDESSDTSIFIRDFEAMLKFETMDISVLKKAIMDHYKNLYDRLLDVYQKHVDACDIHLNDVDFDDVFIEFMMSLTPMYECSIKCIASRLYTLDDELEYWFDDCVQRVIYDEEYAEWFDEYENRVVNDDDY